MRVVIDLDRCTGHGRCYALSPEVLTPDEVGHAALVGSGDAPAELHEQARRAADNCPEQAITLVE